VTATTRQTPIHYRRGLTQLNHQSRISRQTPLKRAYLGRPVGIRSAHHVRVKPKMPTKQADILHFEKEYDKKHGSDDPKPKLANIAGNHPPIHHLPSINRKPLIGKPSLGKPSKVKPTLVKQTLAKPLGASLPSTIGKSPSLINPIAKPPATIQPKVNGRTHHSNRANVNSITQTNNNHRTTAPASTRNNPRSSQLTKNNRTSNKTAKGSRRRKTSEPVNTKPRKRRKINADEDPLYQPETAKPKSKPKRRTRQQKSSKKDQTKKTPVRKNRVLQKRKPIGYPAMEWRKEDIIIPDVSKIEWDEWPDTDDECDVEEDERDMAYLLRHHRAELRERKFYHELRQWRRINTKDTRKGDKLVVKNRPRGPWQYVLTEAENCSKPEDLELRYNFNYPFQMRPWKRPKELIKRVYDMSKYPQSKTYYNERKGKDLSMALQTTRQYREQIEISDSEEDETEKNLASMYMEMYSKSNTVS